MTPLTDHLDRCGRAEGGVIEFELGEGAQNPELEDVCDATGFVVVATSTTLDHVMIVEVKISADGRGLVAVVSTYDGNGQPVEPALLTQGHQAMVTVD